MLSRKSIVCIVIFFVAVLWMCLLPLAVPAWFENFPPQPDPYKDVRSRMLTLGGVTMWNEERLEISSQEYEEMGTEYTYEVYGKPGFLSLSMPHEIRKATITNRYFLYFEYRVSASESANLGNYTFSLTLKIGSYQTTLSVEVYVVGDIPPLPPEPPWFVYPMILVPGFIIWFEIAYLLYLLVMRVIHKLRGY